METRTPLEDRSTTSVMVTSLDSPLVFRTVVVRAARSRDRALGLEPAQRPRQKPSGRRAGQQPFKGSRRRRWGGRDGLEQKHLDRAGLAAISRPLACQSTPEPVPGPIFLSGTAGPAACGEFGMAGSLSGRRSDGANGPDVTVRSGRDGLDPDEVGGACNHRRSVGSARYASPRTANGFHGLTEQLRPDRATKSQGNLLFFGGHNGGQVTLRNA